MESNAYVIFYDEESGDRFFVDFWPEDENNYQSTQRVYNITVTYPDMENFLLVYVNDAGQVTYGIVDCCFEQDGSFRDRAVVYDGDNALDVMLVTMPNYYSDVK